MLDIVLPLAAIWSPVIVLCVLIRKLQDLPMKRYLEISYAVMAVVVLGAMIGIAWACPC
jgi:hypothetical protein